MMWILFLDLRPAKAIGEITNDISFRKPTRRLVLQCV